MLQVHRTALRRRSQPRRILIAFVQSRKFHRGTPILQKTHDPRVESRDHIIEDDFLVLRDNYATPKHPIILAHGLLGFDELHPAGSILPGIQYWRGITEALAARGVEVITAEVPPSGRIEVRAKELAEVIEQRAGGKAVNIIAYGHNTFGLNGQCANDVTDTAWSVNHLLFSKMADVN